MKTTDLRLGNFISINFGNCDDGKIITVDGISDCEIYNEEHGYSPCNEFKPIPLTEHWLLDFGFKYEIGYYSKGAFLISLADDASCFFKDGRVYFNSRLIIENQPKYVHQLQNLYFALTQEELILKKRSKE